MRRFEASFKRGEKNPVKSEASDSIPSRQKLPQFVRVFPSICPSYIYRLPTMRTRTSMIRCKGIAITNELRSFKNVREQLSIFIYFVTENFINHSDTNASLESKSYEKEVRLCHKNLLWIIAFIYLFIGACFVLQFIIYKPMKYTQELPSHIHIYLLSYLYIIKTNVYKSKHVSKQDISNTEK